MRIAVIEDEKAHRELLVHYLRELCGAQGREAVLETFCSGEAFWFRYEECQDFDILFVDIQMPGMNGMELARKVRAQNEDVLIVFSTGIRDYLEESYEVEALHYLIKPFSMEKVQRCLEKAYRRSQKESFVTLHTKEGTLKISQESINYVEARGRSCCVGRTGEAAPLEVKESFSQMEDMLDKEEFVKCHRSFLCRISHIQSIGKEDIIFDDGTSIPVSRRLWQQVNQRFISYFRKDGQGMQN